MKYIELLFHKIGIRLHKGSIGNYYPGSCDQCDMLEGGTKTIIYGLTPNIILFICDKCYNKKEKDIKKIIQHLQEKTNFHKFDKDIKYTIVSTDGHIESNWYIDPLYLFFEFLNNSVYVPLLQKSENSDIPETRILVHQRHLMIMNDLVLVS